MIKSVKFSTTSAVKVSGLVFRTKRLSCLVSYNPHNAIPMLLPHDATSFFVIGTGNGGVGVSRACSRVHMSRLETAYLSVAPKKLCPCTCRICGSTSVKHEVTVASCTGFLSSPCPPARISAVVTYSLSLL